MEPFNLNVTLGKLITKYLNNYLQALRRQDLHYSHSFSLSLSRLKQEEEEEKRDQGRRRRKEEEEEERKKKPWKLARNLKWYVCS